MCLVIVKCVPGGEVMGFESLLVWQQLELEKIHRSIAHSKSASLNPMHV